MKYGDQGTTQLAWPAGVQEARWCSVAPGSPYTSSTGGPQLICATRDSWFGGNWFGLQLLGDGMPRGYPTSVTNVPGLQTQAGASLWAWVFESPTRLWVATSTPSGGVFLYTRSSAAASVPWNYIAQYVIDAAVPFYSLVGRTEDSGQFFLYAAGLQRIVSYNTATLTTRIIAQIANANNHFRSLSFAPRGLVAATPSSTRTSTSSPSTTGSVSNTGTPTRTATPSGTGTATFGSSPTSTMTVTPSASNTATPSPSNVVVRFSGGNLLVLRVDPNPALGIVPGTYAPGFLDEIDPVSGVVVQSIMLPTAASTAPDGAMAYPCTFAVQSGAAADSFPQLSGDGRAVVLPCSGAVPGTPVNHTAGVVPRVFAAIWADPRLPIDTTTMCNDCYNYPAWAAGQFVALRSSASSDVFSGFVFTGIGSPSVTNGGIRYVAYRGGVSSLLSTAGARFLAISAGVPTINNGQPILLAAASAGAGYNGLVWTALPSFTSYAPSAFPVYSPAMTMWNLVSGQESIQAQALVSWQFALSPSGDAGYLLETSSIATRTALYFAFGGPPTNRYTASNLLLETTAALHLTGRQEGPAGNSSFVAYYIIGFSGTTGSFLTRYDPLSGSKTRLAWWPTSSALLGVTWVPIDTRYVMPSRSGTPSNSPTPTSTPSSECYAVCEGAVCDLDSCLPRVPLY